MDSEHTISEDVLLSAEMEYLSRAVRRSMIERVRNNTHTHKGKGEHVVEFIEQKILMWYNHIRIKEEDRISELVTEWEPESRGASPEK